MPVALKLNYVISCVHVIIPLMFFKPFLKLKVMKLQEAVVQCWSHVLCTGFSSLTGFIHMGRNQLGVQKAWRCCRWVGCPVNTRQGYCKCQVGTNRCLLPGYQESQVRSGGSLWFTVTDLVHMLPKASQSCAAEGKELQCSGDVCSVKAEALF